MNILKYVFIGGLMSIGWFVGELIIIKGKKVVAEFKKNFEIQLQYIKKKIKRRRKLQYIKRNFKRNKQLQYIQRKIEYYEI